MKEFASVESSALDVGWLECFGGYRIVNAYAVVLARATAGTPCLPRSLGHRGP